MSFLFKYRYFFSLNKKNEDYLKQDYIMIKLNLNIKINIKVIKIRYWVYFIEIA